MRSLDIVIVVSIYVLAGICFFGTKGNAVVPPLSPIGTYLIACSGEGNLMRCVVIDTRTGKMVNLISNP